MDLATTLKSDDIIEYLSWSLLNKKDLIIHDKIIDVLVNYVNDMKAITKYTQNNIDTYYDNMNMYIKYIWCIVNEYISIQLVANITDLSAIVSIITNKIADLFKSNPNMYIEKPRFKLKDYIQHLTYDSYRNYQNITNQLDMINNVLSTDEKQYLTTNKLTLFDLVRIETNHALIETDIYKYSVDLNKTNSLLMSILVKIKQFTKK